MKIGYTVNSGGYVNNLLKGRYKICLKNLTLKNYKNFKDEIAIDFENIAGYQFNTDCLNDGIIGKMLIYGT